MTRTAPGIDDRVVCPYRRLCGVATQQYPGEEHATKRRIFFAYSAGIFSLTFAFRCARAAEPTVFMSTQLRPIEAAQQMRTVIFNDFQGSVDFAPEQLAEMVVRMQAETLPGRR